MPLSSNPFCFHENELSSDNVIQKPAYMPRHLLGNICYQLMVFAWIRSSLFSVLAS